MTLDSPLHRALAAWRAAEHRLDRAGADDTERARLQTEIERLRTQYQALFEEVEDLAGHSAKYVDEESRHPV
jgi:cell division protein FtsB